MKMKMRALLPVLVLVLGLAALLPARFAAPAGVVTAKADYPKYSVKVDDGYLALRNAKAFDYSNEIGKLYTGEIVQVMDTSDPTYWYVYAQSLGKYGYVNRNYLISVTVSGSEYTVKVDSGYLALRTAKAFDYNNEIGKLYTGEKVQVTDTSDSTYWYVYAPSLGKYGYVNRNYLYKSGSSSSSSLTNPYTVKVDDGYLALRTAKAFDYYNEIGKLWTGDVVDVTDTSDPTYWYVYAPTLGKSGYVNKNYLIYGGGSYLFTRTVKVSDGYLALRTAKAYDYTNEIGKLYTGQQVQVINTADSTYWYVYAPTLNMYGYVNSNYLY